MGGWKCQRRVEIGDKKRILRKIKFVENEKLLVEREEGSKESLVSQRLNRGVHLRTERSTDTAQQAGKMFGSVSYSFCLNSMFPYYLFSSWAHNVCIVSLVGLTSFVSECHITVSSTGLEKKRFVKKTPGSCFPLRLAWEELVWLACLFPFILFSGTCSGPFDKTVTPWFHAFLHCFVAIPGPPIQR